MDGALADCERGFLHRLGEGRVGVAGARDVLGRRAELHRHGCFGNNVAGVGSEDVHASTRSVFASARIFTKPSVCMLTLARPLAVNGNLPTLKAMPASF